jgi:hypothetical protein
MKKTLIALAVICCLSIGIGNAANNYLQTLNVGNLNVFQKSVLKGPITNTGAFSNTGANSLVGNVYMGTATKISTYTASSGQMSFYNEAVIPLATITTNNVSGVSTLSGNVVMGDSTHKSTYTATTGSLALAGSIVPKQLAKAAILALTPVAVGEIYGCSDCTSVTLCVSTSTTVGEWAKVTDRSALCD